MCDSSWKKGKFVVVFEVVIKLYAKGWLCLDLVWDKIITYWYGNKVISDLV